MSALLQATERIQEWAFTAEAAAVAAGTAELPDAMRSAIWQLADAADGDDEAARQEALRCIFPDLVEHCNDRLDAAGRTAYAAFFPALVWRVAQGCRELQARLHAFAIDSEQQCYASYHGRRMRARVDGPAPILPDIVQRVVVLSRVTIGADILITSVLCQRLQQAFPAADIVVLGDGKLGGLLAGLAQVRVEPLRYARRGPLGERLGSWLQLLDRVDELAPDLVVSPDSRLDQLGVLPMCEDETAYLLWENIMPEAGAACSLAQLMDDWCNHVLALHESKPCMPRVALAGDYALQAGHWQQVLASRPTMAVKLDHGGNPAKALPRAAERQLLQAILDRGWRLLLDRGFGPEELANSDDLLREAKLVSVDIDEHGHIGMTPEACTSDLADQATVLRFHGSIAGWAAMVSGCGYALSYDSVGHHLAGALAVPVLSVFTGFSRAVFPQAWCPRSTAPVTQVVIPTDQRADETWWHRVRDALPEAPAQG